MANKDIEKFCKDGLLLRDYRKHYEEFLTGVKAAKKWKNTVCKLETCHVTYKYRKALLLAFIDKKKAENFKLTDKTIEQFFHELKGFSYAEEAADKCEENESRTYNCLANIFDRDDFKVEGVVVRRTNQEAWILVKKTCSSNGKQEFEYIELLLDLKNFGADDVSRAFLKVGDILEISVGFKGEEIALEPEIICCYELYEEEMKTFFKHLHMVESDGSSAIVVELLRCHAFWEYILQHSWNYSNQTKENFSHDILLIIDKICSSSQRGMLPPVQGIVQEFSKTTFFKYVLPEIVENIAKKSCGSESFKVVQNVLEHVLNVSPSSGRRVLPMANVLAASLVSSSSGQCAVDYLAKLSLMVAIAVPGVHADLEALSWRELPLLPLSEEIHKDSRETRTADLPVIKKEGKYHSEKEYLNTYFRLLRAECFHKLRDGVSKFLSKGKCDSRDVMIYRITLKGLHTLCRENCPTPMSIGLQFTVDSEERIDWGSTNYLVYGNLLCISCDGSFEQPVWAVVEKVYHEQRVMWVTLCGDKTNNISEAEFVIQLQGITDSGKEAYMAESQTFYLSFGPAMDILQHKDSVPFKEFLVYPEAKRMCQADYISKVKAPPDWAIIFESPPKSRDQDESSVYSLVDDFERIKFSSTKAKLDDTQRDAIDLTFKNKVALIQGPPGTGKSFVGVSLVHLLLSMYVPKTFGPILVVTYKNNALDHFLEECQGLSPRPRIIRVGKGSSSDRLKDCLLAKVKLKFVWSEVLKTHMEKLRVQLQSMQDHVKEAYLKLQGSWVFNVEMFIQTANEKQVRALLVNTEIGSIDQAEVDKLLKERNMDGSYKSHSKGLIREALEQWLPPQEKFYRFASENGFPGASGKPSHSVTNEECTKSQRARARQRKLDQEEENFENFREPSVEENERMSSALEDDLPSDDMQGISDTRPYDTSGERKLIAMDDRRVAPFKRYSGDTNIWALDEHARIKLVYAFQSLYAEKARKEFLNVSRETLEKHQQYAALRNKHDIDVMKNCEILGMTVTGAAMRANLLEEIKPSVMIVEEAAEILEGQLVAAIPPSVQHLILIGDHKQLKPVVKNSRLRRSCHLDVSMFERLVNCDIPLMQLEYQCRMREDIVDLLRSLNIYKELKTKTELICKYNPPHCVEKSMYFCFHKSDEKPSKDSHSKRNPTEARMITEAAKKFCKGGVVRPSEITVLCAYRGQIREINDSFKSSNVAEMAEIKVTTIDAFQGQENNIILVSLVRSNAENKIGYLTKKNRICVAISRARCGLYLFGNQAQLASASGVWRAIVEYMREKDCLVKEIPFRSIDETASSSRSEGESESGSSLKGRAKSGAQNTTFNIQAQNVNIFNFIGDQTVVQIPDNSTSAEMITQRTQTPGSGGTPSEEPQSYLIDISKVKTKEQSEEGSKFPTQEEGFEEVNKEKPIQETQVARKAQEVEDEDKRQGDQVKRVQQELGNREPLQAENGRSTVETESYREEASPMQETMATDKSTSAEMTTCQLQTPGSGEINVQSLSSAGTPSEERESSFIKKSKVETKEQSEEGGKFPTQEEGFEEFDKAKPIQETQESRKLQEVKNEDKRQVDQVERVQQEVDNGEPLQTEKGRSTGKTESYKEEASPIQETMAAGKGPFEETGLEVGVKIQPTDEKE